MDPYNQLAYVADRPRDTSALGLRCQRDPYNQDGFRAVSANAMELFTLPFRRGSKTLSRCVRQ